VDHFPEAKKMRIVFIIGLFPALSETFILNQIAGLIDSRYEPFSFVGVSCPIFQEISGL